MDSSDTRKVAAVYVPIDQLRPWVKNPRKNDSAADHIATSIRRFGFGSPILARRDNGEVIAGHTRLKAAVKLGLSEVPVRYLDLSEAEAHALALADNKLGEIAEWDSDMLSAVLRDLEAGDTSLDGLGFDADALHRLLHAQDLADDDDETEPLPVPEPEDAVSQTGEVYELGPHRLVCGSSTDAASWEALLGAERLRMIWTDPPYGVAVVGRSGLKTADGRTGRHITESEARAMNGGTIENDALSPKELEAFLRDAIGLAVAHCAAGAAVYVAAPSGPLHGVFGNVLCELDIWRRSLVWLKDSFVLSRSDHHGRHEDIFYGWTPGAAHYWCGRRDIDTIFEVPRPKRSTDHPTMKPVKLVRQHIEHSSQPGWLVGEPFGGSGTTLIAAACTGRIARLIELSPGYCDVIRRRWTRWARANGQDPGKGALDG